MANSSRNATFVLIVLMMVASVPATNAERCLQLQYYVHEYRGGPASTTLTVVGNASFGMGTLLVFDNIVREGAAADSKLLGNATGSAAIASARGVAGGIQLLNQVTFGQGSPYNGSSILFMGTFAGRPEPYEIGIVGGTGYFRGARGHSLSWPGPSSPPLYTIYYELSICLSADRDKKKH